YVFSETEKYLSINNITDVDGKITFRLPAGTYKFRADYQGSHYWSDIETLTPDQVNSVTLDTGGGVFDLTVLKGEGEPLENIRCYVFNTLKTYLGMSGTTDSSGQVQFSLADGDYKLRVDHLGYQFWAGDYEVPAILSDEFTIIHSDVIITVEGLYQTPEPLEDLTVHLFKPPEVYMSQNQVTDANGQVGFNLPDQTYKVRVDYLNQKFW
ncbi:MAG: hypothetical protein GY841_02630, partial [FCB group bacterium]|nr:hypothetical protein [FCB group bacterium]